MGRGRRAQAWSAGTVDPARNVVDEARKDDIELARSEIPSPAPPNESEADTYVTSTSSTLRTLVAGELIVEQIHPQTRGWLRDAIGRVALMLADTLAVAVALVVAVVAASTGIRPVALLLAAIFWTLAGMAGLYGRDEHVVNKTTLDEGPRLLSVAAVFAVIVASGGHTWTRQPLQPLLAWAVLAVGLVLLRSGARLAVATFTPPERVLIVGDRLATSQIARAVAQNRSANAVVVGRLVSNLTGEPLGDPMLKGGVQDLGAVIEDHRVERVIVISAEAAGRQGLEVVTLAKASGVKVSLLPPLLEVMGSSVEHDGLGGQALLSMRPFGLSRRSRFLKRTFDLVLAGTALALLSPLLAAIALAVRLSSSGPVIFRQARIGREGLGFEIMKFRTMVVGAERRQDELREHNEAAPLFKIADDPRITRVGRFLRRQSLDELPQLINVLRGEMSIVGPRPLVAEEDRLFSGWQRLRYHVAPGITGPWQVLGSSRVPFEDMVMLDYLYGATWSIWLDVKIVLRTVPAILSRQSGEYSASRR